MKATQHLQISNNIISKSLSSFDAIISEMKSDDLSQPFERVFYPSDKSVDSGYEVVYSCNGKVASECQYENGLKHGVEFIHGTKSFRLPNGFNGYYYFNIWRKGVLVSSKYFCQISRTEFKEAPLPKKVGAKYFIEKSIERQLMMPVFQELNEGSSITADSFAKYEKVVNFSFCLECIFDNKN